MDSLSQIVLGAAVGEAVLGRRIGNRAMIWGAVAGTIPDMDVLGKYVLSELDNLGFHRGISHSLLFSVVGASGLWVGDRPAVPQPPPRLDRHGHQSGRGGRRGLRGELPDHDSGAGSVAAACIVRPARGPVVVAARPASLLQRHVGGPGRGPAGLGGPVFWGFLTHILLDCFTTYGTQIFAPFSNMRVAWGTISVADPLYTVPFLICLLVAARFARTDRRRAVWNWVGIGLSSAYLLLTVVHYNRVSRTFTDALAKQDIAYERFFITPTIFNNVLWNGVVDAGEVYLLAQHSFYDEVPMTFTPVAKGFDLLHNIDTDPTLTTLRWFSAGYLNAVRRDDGQLQVNDLRFGTFSGEATGPDDYIFRFNLVDHGPDAPYGFQQAQGGPPDDTAETMMRTLVKRARGIKAPPSSKRSNQVRVQGFDSPLLH